MPFTHDTLIRSISPTFRPARNCLGKVTGHETLEERLLPGKRRMARQGFEPGGERIHGSVCPFRVRFVSPTARD